MAGAKKTKKAKPAKAAAVKPAVSSSEQPKK